MTITSPAHEPADYQAATALLAAFPDKPLTLFDAVAVTASRRLQCPVWSFDRHFDFLPVDRWK